jgi:2'-5' RNA ligase
VLITSKHTFVLKDHMSNSWLSFTLPGQAQLKLHDLCKILSTKFKFNPMSYDGLHMTAVFMGKSYKSKDQDRIFELIEEIKLSGSFEFDRLDFFPPTKNNLIVAIFKSSSKDIHEKLKLLKIKISDELGYEVDNGEFLPHVTLGKLIITRKQLAMLIKENSLVDISKDVNNVNFNINVHNPLYLCGKK